MSTFCNDRDLLAVEPGVFTGGGFPSQILAAGSGTLTGTTFVATGADFPAAGVRAGMVICLYGTAPAEGTALEIVSVDSATQLTVSALRADPAGPPCGPPPGLGNSFQIRTFLPQIQGASATLAEKLRQLAEVAGVKAADFADSAQLAAAAACGTLAGLFVARAENATPSDANWVKAEYYRAEFGRRQLQLRLATDLDGDGLAETTRTLGNVTLRRV